MTLRKWIQNIQDQIDLGRLDGSKPVEIFNRRGDAETPVLSTAYNFKTKAATRHTIMAPGDE